MGLADLFHSIATGSKRKRDLLTPVGLVIFGLSLVIVIAAGLATDRAIGAPPLLPGATGAVVGTVLLASGAVLCGWCVASFLRARGTPVPFNPPKQLVVTGPYLWMRNPMVTGVFGVLFGLGFLLHSPSIVLIWTPLYVLAHVIELRRVEEPELERRFGASYTEYRRAVPMFIPRPWRRRGRGTD
jgi:protein-S-isoprenylcysteine O-methyltransferase Ste14